MHFIEFFLQSILFLFSHRTWYVACINGSEPGLRDVRVINMLLSRNLYDTRSHRRVKEICM